MKAVTAWFDARLRWLDRYPTLKLVSRFVVAGVLNTIVGLSVTLTLDLGLGVAPALANAAGYAVGIMVSWVLQRRFVFRTEQAGWDVRARYLTTIAISFGVNQGLLQVMGSLLGDASWARALAQLIAMASYTAVQFLLFRAWVFRSARTPAA